MELRLVVEINEQQEEVLRLWSSTKMSTSEELATVVAAAFSEYAERHRRLGQDGILSESGKMRSPYAFGISNVTYGEIREEVVLEPVAGVALPIDRGEVLRIVQENEGGQCVDFNAFSMNDYKERLDVGRTRAWNGGIFVRRGAILYSNSPRDRAMFEILQMPDTCRAETTGARCNAALFERGFGLSWHTNCQDTLAECVGEFGLTPDDVHDSFNMWMNTEVDQDGQLIVGPNTGRKGDHVDLLAAMDTLSVPVICGSGDVMFTSNFALKNIRIQVFSASDSSLRRVEQIDKYFQQLGNVRSASDFRVAEIRAERQLRRDPDYVPHFRLHPLTSKKVVVELTDAKCELLTHMRADHHIPGSSDAEIVRACSLLAYLRRADASIRR